MSDSITKELIFDHFNHKTTPIQRKMVYEWLQNEKNEELYYEWLEEWECSHVLYVPDTNGQTRQYTEFLAQDPPPDIIRSVRKLVPFKPGRRFEHRGFAAAGILLLLSISTFLLKDKLVYKTYHVGFGEIYTFVLTDGTEVTLNANSSLKLSRFAFNNPSREVFLNGEAKFSVAHRQDNTSFLVKTGNDFEVKVLGTEFEVYARHKDRKVVLNKGEVQLQYLEGTQQKQVLMHPGDHFELDQRTSTVQTKQQPIKDFASWTQKRFVFDEKSLKEVAEMLHENYGLVIEIPSKDLAERVIMGSFKADNEDELLQSISELLDISVLKEGKHVQLIEK